MTLTVPEAAKRYGRTEQHIRKLAADQAIKARKVGPLWLLNERSVAVYFAKERRPGPKPRRRP